MQRIVRDFHQSLQRAAGTEMQAIAQALGGLSGSLQDAIGRMDHSGGQFGR